MLKGTAILKFKFHENPMGMQMYVAKPIVDDPPPQEGEDVHAEDKEAEIDPPEDETAAEEVPKEPEKPANTGEPLVMTPYPEGLSTGSQMIVTFQCSKDVMRSLMDAEARGLAPVFSFAIK